ncbi:MAG: tRNA lysidine(34) synthetase TilS [Planctomycetota bacterium]
MGRTKLFLFEQFKINLTGILRRIEKAYKVPQNMIKHPKFILGVSGGPDSMAMLFLFYNLSLHKSMTLLVAHYNHMTRKEESMRDEQFVIDNCKKLNIEIITGRLQQKRIIANEEFLRNKRFAFFKSIVKKEQPCFLSLAHTKDDDIETVFINLLQGKILKPMLGINEFIKLPDTNSFLIHPLLNIGRDIILKFIMECDIPYVIDSSNLNDIYLRNYVRHKIFSTFKTYKDSFFYSLESIKKIWHKIGKKLRQELLKHKIRNG